MRIAFLCKRRYMGKDVIDDRYARLYEFPAQLARQGHAVLGLCLDYHRAGGGEWDHPHPPGSLHWSATSLRGGPGVLGHPSRTLHRLRDWRPDVLVGASDIPHVAFAAWLARRLGLPYAVDLYDNFEGFGQARVPGMVSLLRRATRGASLVTTTSEPLRRMVVDTYDARGTVVALPSSVDKSVFSPGDRDAARRSLGLPANVPLVGTAGGLYRDKGIVPLLDAWRIVATERHDAHLVLAGPTEAGLPLPEGPRVHLLGHLPHAQVADVFRALDVGVISVLDTPFGRYCFPQKAYEMIACGTPVVAADVGAMSDLFAARRDWLFTANDSASLARAILARLDDQSPLAVPVPSWQELMAPIGPMLERIAMRPAAA